MTDNDPNRHSWAVAEVSDAVGPAANLRNYLEQRDLRRCLAAVASSKPIRSAADIGCGYGRLTMVCAEFAREVAGFEREGFLLQQAKPLLPHIDFTEVDSLDCLPVPDARFDFALIFTVLQHMREKEARATVQELKRIANTGFILIVEETDPTLRHGDPEKPGTGITVGRRVDTYAGWMLPFSLALSFPRQIEPIYPRANVGSYMLFAAPQA